MPDGPAGADLPEGAAAAPGESGESGEPGKPGALVCATCGAVPADEGLARLTWARGVEQGREVWTCDTCSRRHLRSIEGKLDSSWW
jgi:hypothetical protein